MYIQFILDTDDEWELIIINQLMKRINYKKVNKVKEPQINSRVDLPKEIQTPFEVTPSTSKPPVVVSVTKEVPKPKFVAADNDVVIPPKVANISEIIRKQAPIQKHNSTDWQRLVDSICKGEKK
jgi:hypothetical protein